VGNRVAIQPMEGWDGTADGNPSELTVRRWQRFGCSGRRDFLPPTVTSLLEIRWSMSLGNWGRFATSNGNFPS